MKKTVRTFTTEILRGIIAIIKSAVADIESGDAIPRIGVVGGNTKLGTIPAFNLPPLVTCTNCSACSKHCYACKDYKSMRVKSVSRSHARNLAAVQTDIELAFKDLDSWLEKHNPSFFRIHSSGDFFVNVGGDYLAYATHWYELAKRHPGTRFLAFTKDYDAARTIPLDTLENFSLVLSEWTDELSAPDDLKTRYRTSRAVESLDDVKENELICPGSCETCGMCWQLSRIGRDVAFEIH